MIAQVPAKEIVATHAKHCAIWNVEIIVQKLVQELVQGLVQEVVKENVQKPARMIALRIVQALVLELARRTVIAAVRMGVVVYAL